MLNWPQTVLSQFQSSPRIYTLLRSIESWLSPTANFEAFYDLIWNVDTAVGYGLDVWGRIVNIPRIVSLVTPVPTFGFFEAGDRAPFGHGPFYEAGHTDTENFRLTDDPYRRLILAKAAYNITNGSIPAINAIMLGLFPGRGNCWVVDGGETVPGMSPSFGFFEAGDRLPFGFGPFGDILPAPVTGTNMTLTYTFSFKLTEFEMAMVKSGVLPKPTGVKAFWAFLAN